MTSKLFSPTYLYIKQHTVTGKLYFGKTTRNPETYLGSGKHWKRHIELHGKEHVVNLWYCLFYDEEQISLFALNFSEQQNIVESDDWLNLKVENGLDGGSIKGTMSDDSRTKLSHIHSGKILTTEHKAKISTAKIGKPRSDETRQKIAVANIGKVHPHSDETKAKISAIQYGKKQQTAECPHCGKVGGVRALKRYHFDNCTSNSLNGKTRCLNN